MHIVIVALILFILEWRVVRPNVGAKWNGYGALGGTFARVNRAPMRYRVLGAWLVGWIPEPWRLPAYCIFKFGLLAGMLVVAEALLGTRGMLVVAVLTALTFEFDYWDCYAETLAVLLCLSGDFWLALLGGSIWGLSKETFVLAPVVAGLGGGMASGLGAGMGCLAFWSAMRIWQGEAGLYCKRWTMKPYNIPDLKQAWKRLDPGPVLSILWCLLAVAVTLLGRGRMPAPFARSAWVSLAWVGAGWVLARGRETRVFLPAAVWMAAYLT